MKTRYFRLGLALLILSAAACGSCSMKDKGNYDYIPADEFIPVEIDGFDDLPASRALEPLYYEPKFVRMDDESRYKYTWYTIQYTAGVGSTKKVICETMNLDVESLPLTSGVYDLYLQVLDERYDVCVKQKGKLTVTDTDFLNGFYILKDKGEQTDVDYFVLDNATDPIPETIKAYTDLLGKSMGQPLPGKPKGMMWYNFAYTYQWIDDEDRMNTTRITNGLWFIMTEKEIVSVQNNFSKVFQKNRDFFLTDTEIDPIYFPERPTRRKDLWMMNDNNVYSIYGNMPHVGLWTNPVAAGELNFFPQMLGGEVYGFTYERISGTFYLLDSYSATLTSVIPWVSSSALPNKKLITDKEVEPIAILYGGGNSNIEATKTCGNVLLKHKTQSDKFYMSRVEYNSANASPFRWIRPVDPAADIVKSPVPVMSSSYIGDVIYYAKGNELWMYKDGGDTETPAPLSQRQVKAATLGSGETVVEIKPVQFFNAVNLSLSYNWICVLTNTADGNYKLYAFENDGPNPELKPTPKLLLQGEGTARVFMPRLKYID